MKLLVIEDTIEKRKKLVDFLIEKFPQSNIEEAESYNGGVEKILNDSYDLVLLDMSMPTFDSDASGCAGRMRALAGRDVISKMQRRNKIFPVVVVTRFDAFGAHDKKTTLNELDTYLSDNYPEIYMGSVFFEYSSNSWFTELDKILKRIGLVK